MTVAVDFDGVIHSYEKGWQNGDIYGELIEGSVPALLELMAKDAVFIHTTREPQSVARWLELKSAYVLKCTPLFPKNLEFWNLRDVLLVTNRKLPAVAYIDDRGIRFENWAQALSDLARFTR